MVNLDNWQLLHRYKGLVKVGQARDFLCPECHNSLQSLRDNDSNPVLWCPYDDSVFVPGAEFWGDVKAVVTEYYLE